MNPVIAVVPSAPSWCTGVMNWFVAGTVCPHWVWFALFAFLVIEYGLPRIKSVRARSIFEAVANTLLVVLKGIPVIAEFVAKLGTPPTVPVVSDPPKTEAPKGPTNNSPLVWFLLPVLFVSLSGCTPAWMQAWKALGQDTAACAKPGATAAVDEGVAVLVDVAQGTAIDYAAVGKNLVVKYGIDLAWCIVEAAAKRLGPVIFGDDPHSARPTVQWLRQHPGDWLKK